MRCSQTYIINVEGRKGESERERNKEKKGGRDGGRGEEGKEEELILKELKDAWLKRKQNFHA